MTVSRIVNVGIVLEDLSAGIDFFVELGMELEHRTKIEAPWADRVVGIKGMQVEIAMMGVANHHTRVELMQFYRPTGTATEPAHPPANALGIRRVMFSVDNIEDTVARLCSKHGRRAHGRNRCLRRLVSAVLPPRPGRNHRRSGARSLRVSAARQDETAATPNSSTT